MLQIGTETDISAGSPSQPFAWVEYLPFNATQLPLTGWITISAGDTVQAQMFLGDSNGNTDQNGLYAFFYLEILSPTTASTGWLYESVSSAPANFGSSAEAIVERTAEDCNGETCILPFLADYDVVEITMEALDSNRNLHNFSTDNTSTIWMCNAGTACSSTSNCGSNLMSAAGTVNTDVAYCEFVSSGTVQGILE